MVVSVLMLIYINKLKGSYDSWWELYVSDLIHFSILMGRLFYFDFSLRLIAFQAAK